MQEASVSSTGDAVPAGEPPVPAPRRVALFRVTAAALSLVLGGALSFGIWRVVQWMRPTTLEIAAREFDAMWQKLPAESRELLRVGGYGPEERLVVSANFDAALVFSGKVFETSRTRGYRLRPSQANLWCLPTGQAFQVLLPDSEPVRTALEAGQIDVTQTERSNSLGCRGPELGAIESYEFRVLVLGDSFTQGILVAESQTFCSLLQRELDRLTGQRTLVVNAGVIGYSTEQQYNTLVELTPKIRPHLVLLCFFANDVHHDHNAVMRKNRAQGVWAEAQRWLGHCLSYCRAHDSAFLVAAIPGESQMWSRRSRVNYQHKLEQITAEFGISMIDPDERFWARRDQPLWLAGDGHFSAAGHALFADVLAEHLRHWASN